jgi:hypothetical protein
MSKDSVGASARPFANALTLALSIFAAWGWSTEVSWPLTLASVGWLVLAAITLATQQLANAAAALAQRAIAAPDWVCGLGGVVLAIIFAGVTAVGVEHGWAATQDLVRAERTAPLLTEIAGLEAEIAANHVALRSIPADVPGSRIVLLQAPLNQALQEGQERLDLLRADLVEAQSPGDYGDAELIFWLLGFAEPALYWLLAAAETRPVPSAGRPVPPAVPAPDRSPCPEPVRPAYRRPRVPRRVRAALSGALSALALHMPGAAAPQMLASAAAPETLDPAETRPDNKRPTERQIRRDTSPVGRASHARGTPHWLGEAVALRAQGLSIRAIGRRIVQPKSTVGRWLKQTGAGTQQR